MCSLAIECVLLLQSVFSYLLYRVCSLTAECVLLLQNAFSYYRMCSLTIECVLLPSLQSVFSYYRMCSQCVLRNWRRRSREQCQTSSPSIECVFLLQNVFSYYRMCSQELEEEEPRRVPDLITFYRMCSLTIECVLRNWRRRSREQCQTSSPSLLSSRRVKRFSQISLVEQNVSSYYSYSCRTSSPSLVSSRRFSVLISDDRMCSLTIECVLLRQNVFSYDRMCSLTKEKLIECVLLIESVFSCYRMRVTIERVLLQKLCSLTPERVL